MIPKLVHRLWLGGHPMPEPYRRYRKQWEALGYIVCDWLDDDLDESRNQDVLHAITAAPDSTGIHRRPVEVQHADVWSYELIWRHGGIYSNCDIEPLRDLHDLVDGLEAFVVGEDDRYLSNALFGALPGSSFLDTVIRSLPTRYRLLVRRPMNEQTGPYLLTDVHNRERPDIPVLEPRPFFPYGYWNMEREHQPIADRYWVAHHWGHKHPELH